MERSFDAIEMTIPESRTLRIQDAKDVALQPVDGCVWVTYEDDIMDVVVEAGDALRVARNGVTLVHAFKAARVRIAYPADAGAPSMTFGGGYRAIGTRILAGMLSGWVRALRDRFGTAAARGGQADVNVHLPA